MSNVPSPEPVLPGSGTQVGRRARARRERDPYLDNARALLIVLVVIGHAIEQAKGTAAANALYLFIYSFHMPAFVLITGYLTRGFRASPKAYLKIVTHLLVPYVIFQVLHQLCTTVLVGKPFELDLLMPAWTLWFLLAMAWWRAITPLVRRLPYRVPISLAISLGAGFLPELTGTLALNRTLTLLPFFVLGLSLKPRHLELLKENLSRVGGMITLALLGVLAFGIHGAVPKSTFFYNASFAELAGDDGQAIMFRVATLATGIIGACAVLAITSAREHWWTHLGTYSVYIYLLHAMVLQVLRSYDLVTWPTSTISTLVVAGAATVLAIVLASRPVRAVTKPVVQPPLQKLVDLVPDAKT